MIATPIACAVDASVEIKPVITESLSNEAHALFGHLARDPSAQFFVPDLFDVKCANILALALAIAHKTTAYDACYVAAAQRLRVPLITADTKLANKMAATTYQVLDLAGLSISPPPP